VNETTPITDQFGARLEHQVHDHNVTRMAIGGPMTAVCGATITPAPMVSPEGKPCPACAAKTRNAPRTAPPSRNRRITTGFW
jgi:hypothetical protein